MGWIEDEERRNAAKVPKAVEFRTKPEIALSMIKRALDVGFEKPRILLADSGYGNSAHFRHAVRAMGFHYGVGIKGDLKLWRLDKDDLRRGPATSAEKLAARAKFRKITWAEGTKGSLASRFSIFRVRTKRDDDYQESGSPAWLVIEQPSQSGEKVKYHLSSLPKTTSHRQLVFHLHQRWRIERVYEDMKQEFGLDHYEGRSYIGWNHHVTASMVCYNFAAAELARLSPPAEASARHFATFRSAA